MTVAFQLPTNRAGGRGAAQSQQTALAQGAASAHQLSRTQHRKQRKTCCLLTAKRNQGNAQERTPATSSGLTGTSNTASSIPVQKTGAQERMPAIYACQHGNEYECAPACLHTDRSFSICVPQHMHALAHEKIACMHAAKQQDKSIGVRSKVRYRRSRVHTNAASRIGTI